MVERLDWERDGAAWPNRETSRFVEAGGLRWHVQVFDEDARGASARPMLLLLHGTGAATHSWRDLAPALAQTFHVVAPDLPGHGFTDAIADGGPSIDRMAQAVAALLRRLDVEPAVSAGHSAGAAILIRMRLMRLLSPAPIVSLNGALLALGGFAGQLFSPLAKLLSLNPFVPGFMSRRLEDEAVLDRMLAGTGSRIDLAGRRSYRLLAGSRAHVAGALAMMANWDLPRFARDLPRLDVPLTLVAGTNDRTISPEDAARVARLVPDAKVVRLPRLGHLAHEEDPASSAAIIREAWERASVPAEGARP
jgi:magnesium chelatase accessory protein